MMAFTGSNSHAVHNSTVDDAMDLFSMVPIRPDDWDLLGMQWQGSFYLDNLLTLWAQICPNQFAEARHWILHNNYLVAVHYLDDFSIVGAPVADQCASSVQLTLRVCESLGIPVA